MKFDLNTSKNLVTQIRVLLKSDTNREYFT